MTVREKIDLLKDQRKLNNRQLSMQSNIPYSTIDNWYKRADPDDMRVSTFRKLCDFFGVTMESMAYDEKEIEYRSDRAMEYSTAEADLIRGYRAASEEIQDNMRYQARTALIKKKDDTGTSSDSAAG